MAGRALLIANPKSRSGEEALDAGLKRLRDTGLELLEAVPDGPGGIPELIRRHRDRVDRVILGGGDGTLNCAAPALVETGLPLGVLPLGTANDLARTLMIPADLEAACRIIGEERLHTIDLGEVNGHYFFNVANIGLGVRVTRALTAEVKQRWGVLSYARSVALALRENKAFRARILLDKRKLRVRSIQIAVGNGRFYGGGMTVAEEAAIDDGLLFLYSLKPGPWWRLALLAPALKLGPRGQEQDVRLLRGREIEIRTRKRMEVVADGEPVTQTPARFRVLRGAVKVYVPWEYLSPRQAKP
ncbi:MAG: lipid kinase [Candidatus Competibacteraceae bacterium]|nr:lipid kinase [Candidatus Competibacteraceae bacterium]